jgi:glycosyltransferase involved in cell wall biosynthesis
VPLVSVLMSVHNDAAYVGEAVESVLRQTLSDLELIVVDDASTDATPDILGRTEDSRLTVLRNDERLGLAASLNRGLDAAAGRYVARLDADDIALPDRLQLQVAGIQADPRLAVIGSAVLDVDERDAVGTLHRSPSGPRAVRWLALFSSPFFHPTVLVDRGALDDHGLRYDTSYAESEDYDLWTRLLEHAEGANLPDALVLKRVHPGQASVRRADLQQRFRRQVALREIARVAPELSAEEREAAWRLTDRDAFRSLLKAFEARHGVDPEVREAAARTLRELTPRLVIRRGQRLVDQRAARRKAGGWLASLGTVRVAVVSPEPTPYRAPLFDRIAERGDLDLTVVYAAETVAGRHWSVALQHEAVFLDGPRLPGAARVLRHDYPVTPGIFGALRSARPDVVVVSGWSTFASQAALAWCRARRVPYVLLVESHDVGPRAGWRRAVKGAVVPRLIAGARSFLAVGSLARDSLIARGAPPERIRFFANTIDVERWVERAARTTPRPHDDVVVLSVGRLVGEKAFDVLGSACAEAGVRLVLAGDGPERRRLEPFATVLGDVREEELAQEYVDADVFALLSRHETWGVVVNEAAASGLPLVLSDRVGAADDLLRDGENGFLVPADDVAAAAGALRTLAADADLRRLMGERSRERVRAWDYDASVDAFVAAVREATAR